MHNGFDIEIVVKDKGKRQFLYEVKFIENKKIPQNPEFVKGKFSSATDEELNGTPKHSNFKLPVMKNRQKVYKVPSGEMVYTCFISDFLLEEADEWRKEAWGMIRKRSDLKFLFITKRITRFEKCIPDDLGDGCDNVIIGCTAEN